MFLAIDTDFKTLHSSQWHTMKRYKELQAIRGVVEVKEINQGDDEDAVQLAQLQHQCTRYCWSSDCAA